MFENAGFFLVNTLFNLYIYVVIFRVLLQYYKAPYYNPICAASIQATDFLLKPMRRFIPGFRGFDLAGVVLFLFLVFLKIALLALIVVPVFPSLIGFFLWGLASGLKIVINFYFFAIIAQAIMSWVSSLQTHPLFAMLALITQPLLWPIQRRLPRLGGFDLSPLVVLLLLKLIDILVIVPFLALAMRLF